MIRCIFVILVGFAALLFQTTQSPAPREVLPSVSISLPPDVPSETVQISYFLIGPFGGYGGYAAQRTGVHSYEIPTIVEGKAATEIRMIVYGLRLRNSTVCYPAGGAFQSQPGVPMSTRRDR